MDQRLSLVTHGPGHFGMTMTQIADRDAGQKIQVFFAGFIPEPGALTSHKHHRQARVSAEDVLLIR